MFLYTIQKPISLEMDVKTLCRMSCVLICALLWVHCWKWISIWSRYDTNMTCKAWYQWRTLNMVWKMVEDTIDGYSDIWLSCEDISRQIDGYSKLMTWNLKSHKYVFIIDLLLCIIIKYCPFKFDGEQEFWLVSGCTAIWFIITCYITEPLLLS
jgi:hypothetical protein